MGRCVLWRTSTLLGVPLGAASPLATRAAAAGEPARAGAVLARLAVTLAAAAVRALTSCCCCGGCGCGSG